MYNCFKRFPNPKSSIYFLKSILKVLAGPANFVTSQSIIEQIRFFNDNFFHEKLKLF